MVNDLKQNKGGTKSMKNRYKQVKSIVKLTMNAEIHIPLYQDIGVNWLEPVLPQLQT